MKKTKKINNGSIDVEKAFIELTCIGKRSPSYVNIKSLLDLGNFNYSDSNIQIVEMDDSDVSTNINLPLPLKISIDENFLYVWTNDKWKRVPLSEF